MEFGILVTVWMEFWMRSFGDVDGVVMHRFRLKFTRSCVLNALRRSTFCGHAARRPALRLSLVVPHLLLGAVPPSVGTLRVGLCP